MKIAFWGMEKESGTTSNLMAIGSYIACHSKRQVVMMQLEREKQDLRQNFMRMETELVREKGDYFVLEGLDYLLSMGKQHKLTEKVVRETIEPIIENRLYLVPSGNRKWQSFETEEGNEIIRQVIAFLEKNMDVTLIDCGNRMDDETVISAIKSYAAYKEKDLNRLAAYAEKFRVSKILKQYMEVLL